MAKDKELYIGLMSGTSLDGVDGVIYDFASNTLIANNYISYSNDLKNNIKNLVINPSLEDIASVDIKLAKLYAKVVINLLTKANIAAKDIIAIGNHGQTIYHKPKKYSWQLGNNKLLAQLTTITTIGNFRSADIFNGGEGAPLTPKYHQYLLGSDGTVINLGGIANITKIKNNKVIGYDIGPANTLIDNYMLKHFNISYDRDGLTARSGFIIQDLLDKMLGDSYFQIKPPKSTGVEHFNLTWLDKFLTGNEDKKDIIRTLTELTAITIANNLADNIDSGKVYFCGGGVFNKFLMERIEFLSPKCEILTTNELGVNPQFVEAVAFAYFAKLHIENKTGNVPSVSGAKKAVILGDRYNYG